MPFSFSRGPRKLQSQRWGSSSSTSHSVAADKYFLPWIQQTSQSNKKRQRLSNTNSNQAGPPLFDSIEDPELPFPEFDPGPQVSNSGSTSKRRWADRTFRRVRQEESTRLDWERVLPQLVKGYLLLGDATGNWSNKSTGRDLWLELGQWMGCSCQHTRPHARLVTLVDSLERRMVSLEFCANPSCMGDVLRFLAIGYIPATPKNPCTAFSIRLLLLYQSLWNSTSVSAQGFCDGFSRFLDGRCVAIMAKGGVRPRDFTKPFRLTTAIFERLTTSANAIADDLLSDEDIPSPDLRQSAPSSLSKKCPACFGPQHEEMKDRTEPDIVVALDGNFQLKHRAVAGSNLLPLSYPSSFVSPTEVGCMEAETWSQAVESQAVEFTHVSDHCTDSHTAADDRRNASSFKGFDDTGVVGCVCRHDVCLYLANIEGHGERLFYPLSIIKKLGLETNYPSIGILYDIGCNAEAHILKRDLLPTIRSRLTWGTGVFHSYAHHWSCQLQYNPRLNNGWGLSDGEGSERFWSDLAPLISSLRVSSRQRRLDSIHSRTEFLATRNRDRLGGWIIRRWNQATRRFNDSNDILNKVYTKDNPFCWPSTYSSEFLRAQWNTQRQNQAWSRDRHAETNRKLKIGEMFRLQDQVAAICANLSRDNREPSPEDSKVLSDLKDYLLQIQHLVAELGPEWTLLSEADQNRQRSLLLVWNAKARLRDVILRVRAERQPLDDTLNHSATPLGHRKNTIFKKRAFNLNKQLDTAYGQYKSEVEAYARDFPTQPQPQLPPRVGIAYLLLDDPFWNDGFFTNDGAPWAVDHLTQQGIRALLLNDRAVEERRRLRWEVSRMLAWAEERSKLLNQRLLEILEYQLECRRATGEETHPPPPQWIPASFSSNLPSQTGVDLIATILRNEERRHDVLQARWLPDLNQAVSLGVVNMDSVVGSGDVRGWITRTREKKAWEQPIQAITFTVVDPHNQPAPVEIGQPDNGIREVEETQEDDDDEWAEEEELRRDEEEDRCHEVDELLDGELVNVGPGSE